MKKFEKKSAGPLERLRLKSGIYAASFTVLAILLAVLLNLIVRAVPAKYTEFDLSEAAVWLTHSLQHKARQQVHHFLNLITLTMLRKCLTRQATSYFFLLIQ